MPNPNTNICYTYCTSPGNSHHRRRDACAAADYYYYYNTYHCPTPVNNTAAPSSSSSLRCGRLSSCNSSSYVPTTPPTTETYSPVYSVRHHTCYNYRNCQYETSHITRSLHSSFSHCGHDQVSLSILCARKTAQLLRSFRREVNMCDYDISVVMPCKTTIKKKSSSRNSTWCAPALREDYVPGTKTIFSNSGWTTNDLDGAPKNLLLALPHYSYVWSDKKFIIGSTQAAVDRRKKTIKLVAPTLMSRKAQTYGAEDIGIRGICNFFYWNPSSTLVHDFVGPRYTQLNYHPSPTNRAKCEHDC